MKVDVCQKNVALVNLFENPDTEILLDANLLIPPDRSRFGVRPIVFKQYKEMWLEPLFSEFKNLAIHEAVYDELVADGVKAYVAGKCNGDPPQLRVYKDAMLDSKEWVLLQSYIRKIAVHSKYIPERDNASDRGEVRSLSFMAVKGMIYFASSDALPVRLVEEAEELHTGLDDMTVFKTYEVIYYLYKTGKYNNVALKGIYKYLYYLTRKEKSVNPDWGVFVTMMNGIYER